MFWLCLLFFYPWRLFAILKMLLILCKIFLLKFSFHACWFLCLQTLGGKSDPPSTEITCFTFNDPADVLKYLHKVINQGILHHAMDLRFFYFVIEMYLVLSVWKIISSHCMKSTHSDLESAGACSFPRFNMKDKHCFESVLMIFMWICALYLTPLLYLYFPPLHQSLNPTSSARL